MCLYVQRIVDAEEGESMTLDGYFINDEQHRYILRSLDVLCLAMKQLREDNEKRGDEPDDYIVSCMEVVHNIISETMFDVLYKSVRYAKTEK